MIVKTTRQRAWEELPDLADEQTATVDEKIGRRIFNLRNRRRMNQYQLADATGFQQPCICNYENGTTSIRVYRLVVIAGVLGTTASELLEGIQ